MLEHLVLAFLLLITGLTLSLTGTRQPPHSLAVMLEVVKDSNIVHLGHKRDFVKGVLLKGSFKSINFMLDAFHIRQLAAVDYIHFTFGLKYLKVRSNKYQ